MTGSSDRLKAVSLYDRVQAAFVELLPAMVADGGGAEFVSLTDGVATFRLIGSCLFCPSRSLSASAFQRGLRARVPEITEVVILYPPVPNLGEQLVALADPQ